MIDLYLLAREDYNKTKQILDIVTDGKSKTWGKPNVLGYLRKHTVQLRKLTSESVEWLVIRANKMVKQPECPHNQMNRFYQWKHKYIKYLIKTDSIAEVYESEKHYRFVLKSGNSFHQLKDSFPNGVPYETKQEMYQQTEERRECDNDFINDTILQIALLDVSEG